MTEFQNLKKQALLLLVDKYINESTVTFLQFLVKHKLCTQTFLRSLRSHPQKGLPSSLVQQNQTQYGKNIKQQKENAKWTQLKKLANKQLGSLKTVMIFVMILFELVCGKIYDIREMQLAGTTILITVILSYAIKLGTRFKEKLDSEQHVNKRLLKKYHVYRGDEKIEVTQSELVVGDVLLIDFASPVPVTGILLTDDQQIEMDERIYGRNVQSKKPIEQCLKHLEENNQLQLRVDFEVGRLPSPMIVRGTHCTTNGWFRMLVLCVQQTQILQKRAAKIEKKHSIMQQWITSKIKLMRKIVGVIMACIFLFHALALIFKIRGLTKGNISGLAQAIIENTQTFLCLGLLIDKNLLRDMLRGSYMKVMNMLNSYHDVQKYLAVQQIFLNEQSVFKYDKILLKKVALVDLQQAVDVNLLPALKPQQAYPLFFQIVAGVNLGRDLYLPKQTKNHTNTIIHKVNYHQRHFTSLYSATTSNVVLDSINEGESVLQLLRSQGRAHIEYRYSNQIAPAEQKASQKVRSAQQNLVQDRELKTHLNIKSKCSVNMSQPQTSKNSNRLQLDDYISKYCRFSALSLVQSLNVLAKNKSRTYCFQKYSPQNLQNVVFIWVENEFKPKEKELLNRIQDNILAMRAEGLTVYLIGFQEGSYPKKYITNLFGAVGVQIESNQKLLQNMQKSQELGIKTTFLFNQNKEGKAKQIYQSQVIQQLIKRNWIKNQEQCTKMQIVHQLGGRTICRQCITTNCQCRPKALELANPQGFLEAVNQVKCIWDVTEEDRQYLELGHSQLNIGVIEINGFQQDTNLQFEQIFTAQQLISSLQQNVALWVAWVITVVMCIFPFNYLTFDNIFSHSQLYFALFYFQLLILRHQIVGSFSFFASSSSQNKRKRQILGLDLKIDIILFILLLTTQAYAVISNPLFFSENLPTDNFTDYSCQIKQSFYHNTEIAKVTCIGKNSVITIYSKTSTFIYLFLLFSFTLRAAVTVNDPLNKFNLLYFGSLMGLLLMYVYLFSEWLQFAPSGLSLGELGVCLGAAVSVVFGCFLIRLAVLHIKGKNTQVQGSFGQRGKEKIELLKQYKFSKTIAYPLDKTQNTETVQVQ